MTIATCIRRLFDNNRTQFDGLPWLKQERALRSAIEKQDQTIIDLRRRLDKAGAEYQTATLLLEEMLAERCTLANGELDSMASLLNAETMRMLASTGRLTITSDDGRRRVRGFFVTAKTKEQA